MCRSLAGIIQAEILFFCSCMQVVHCTGYMKTLNQEEEESSPAGSYMTLLCEPIPHPSCVEFPLDSSTFLTRHNMDLHFNQCDGRYVHHTTTHHSWLARSSTFSKVHSSTHIHLVGQQSLHVSVFVPMYALHTYLALRITELSLRAETLFFWWNMAPSGKT